jgi:hypothetical protein
MDMFHLFNYVYSTYSSAGPEGDGSVILSAPYLVLRISVGNLYVQNLTDEKLKILSHFLNGASWVLSDPQCEINKALLEVIFSHDSPCKLYLYVDRFGKI